MLNALLIDHHDSFTYNIKAWLKPYFNVLIVDCAEIGSINLAEYDLVILSPGPKTPFDYPLTLKFLRSVPTAKPVLGICLGLQMMTEVENGLVRPYDPPVHGKTSALESVDPQFNNLLVARYHSLKCELTDSFDVVATSESIPMIVRHKTKTWLGLQFHPESFLTEKPELFLQTVVNLCNR